MSTVVFFSSASNNTARFIEQCDLPSAGIATARIPLRSNEPPLEITDPFVLIVPTYGGGDIHKAVPIQVKRFLNNPENRRWIRGVIASGNTNFGEAYAAAGAVIARKCAVPLLYQFELMGTDADITTVRQGLIDFFQSCPQ